MALGDFAAIAALVLTPFGAVPELLPEGTAWFGFDHQGPILNLVRAQKIKVKSCAAWTDAMVSVPAGEFVPVGSGEWRHAWEPLGEADLEPVRECDDFPCKVKFDKAEVGEMANADESQRLEKFFSLVGKRVERYSQTQVRKAYEVPGDPVDPWKVLEERGFKSALPRPEKPVLFARKLNFAPDKMLTIHQVLDRRSAKSPTGQEAVVWVRDAYTDHYFDGWGEWSLLSCDPGVSEAVMIQTLLSEMDLLKNKNLFARTLYGKYRSAFEENGKKMLNSQFERIQKLARKIEAETPVAAPSISPAHPAKKPAPTRRGDRAHSRSR